MNIIICISSEGKMSIKDNRNRFFSMSKHQYEIGLCTIRNTSKLHNLYVLGYLYSVLLIFFPSIHKGIPVENKWHTSNITHTFKGSMTEKLCTKNITTF